MLRVAILGISIFGMTVEMTMLAELMLDMRGPEIWTFCYGESADGRSTKAGKADTEIAGSRNADAVHADSVSAHAVSIDVRSANSEGAHVKIVNAAQTEAENDSAINANLATRRGEC